MKKYLIRAAKYFVFVVVIFTVIYTVMYLGGMNTVSPDMFGDFAASQQAQIMALVVLGLILVHPSLAYVKRSFNVDIKANRDQVISVFTANGYELVEESDTKLVFRAMGTIRRASMMFEDAITIDFSSLKTTIEGNRKMVVKISFRLSA